MGYFKTIFMLFIINNIQFTYSTYYHSNWTRGIPDLPYPMEGMSVGYDSSNNAIVLVEMGNQKIISYDIDENTFTVHNETLPPGLQYEFIAQGYTQIGNKLYFLRDESPYHHWQYIDSLTLDTKHYMSELFQYERYDIMDGCLSSNDEYIIVSGGQTQDDKVLDRVDIYSISDGVWLSNVSTMNYARKDHSCIVYDNSIYQIGGQTCGKIDKMYIGDGSHSESWVTIRDALSTDGVGSRAVIYNQKIYIINPGTIVDVLDPLTDEITSFIPLLFEEDHFAVGAVAADNKIYAFGGGTGVGGGNGKIQKWQYVEFFPTTTTTTPIPVIKNCDCIGGMVSVTVKYIGECTADITGYYDKKNRVDEIFCAFSDVSTGDYRTCTAAPNLEAFKSSLHFDINCMDDIRRLRKRSSSDSSSADQKDYCTAKLDTSCYVNIIGTQSKKCKDLKVVQYISGDGAICDETVSYNAKLNDEIPENNDPLTSNTNDNPINSSIPIITIIVIVILFVVMLTIAAYCICIRSKKLNSNDVCNASINENSVDNDEQFEQSEKNHLTIEN